MLLEEDLPTTLISALPRFLSAASALILPALGQRGEAAYFCEVLFSMMLLHSERILVALSTEARAELRQLARSLVAATSLGCAMEAASVLKLVGRPEDVAALEAHRPADPTFAKE